MFFVSLYHQSNRMTMFKKTDPNPQLDIFTAPSMQLGSRASKKYSDPNAWHNQFYSLVTTKINEEIFKPLFPEGKKCGRPNASIRILVAMSALKEGFGCSDEDLFEKCEFESSYQKGSWHGTSDRCYSINRYLLSFSPPHLRISGKNWYRSDAALLRTACWQSGTSSQDIRQVRPYG